MAEDETSDLLNSAIPNSDSRIRLQKNVASKEFTILLKDEELKSVCDEYWKINCKAKEVNRAREQLSVKTNYENYKELEPNSPLAPLDDQLMKNWRKLQEAKNKQHDLLDNLVRKKSKMLGIEDEIIIKDFVDFYPVKQRKNDYMHQQFVVDDAPLHEKLCLIKNDAAEFAQATIGKGDEQKENAAVKFFLLIGAANGANNHKSNAGYARQTLEHIKNSPELNEDPKIKAHFIPALSMYLSKAKALIDKSPKASTPEIPGEQKSQPAPALKDNSKTEPTQQAPANNAGMRR